MIALNCPLVVILGLGLIIVLIIIKLSKLKYSNIEENQRRKLSFLLVVILVLAMIFETLIIGGLFYAFGHTEVEYTVELNSSSSTYELVYFPLVENNKFFQSLRIISGNGNLSLVDSEYGNALMINFTGAVKVSSKFSTIMLSGGPELSMRREINIYGDPVYWIYYKPSNSTNYNCTYQLSLEYNGFGSETIISSRGYLNSGWNTYSSTMRGIAA